MHVNFSNNDCKYAGKILRVLDDAVGVLFVKTFPESHLSPEYALFPATVDLLLWSNLINFYNIRDTEVFGSDVGAERCVSASIGEYTIVYSYSEITNLMTLLYVVNPNGNTDDPLIRRVLTGDWDV